MTENTSINNNSHYKNITLISNTNIIIKIFTLVCNKLDVKLSVINNDDTLVNTDILIYEDSEYNKNNTIKYRSYSNTLVVIAKEKMYEYESCYLIKKPFLPSQLFDYLSEIIDVLKNKENELSKINIEKAPEIPIVEELENIIEEVIPVQEDKKVQKAIKIEKSTEHLNQNIDDLVDFIDSIEEDESIMNDVFSNTDDDLIINKEDLGHGGVLDKRELNTLHEMIDSSADDISDTLNTKSSLDEYEEDKSDWIELSEIIDKAIDDVQGIIKDDEIELILNNHSMEEISPLLDKLNQNTLDLLSSGSEITLKIKLEIGDDKK